MSRRRKWAPCRDCRAETLSGEAGVRTEFYVVHDHVRQAAGAPAGYLCVGCLETRLGRRLHRRDFTTIMINDLNCHRPDKAWWWRSDRLVDRLTAPAPQDGIQLALWQDAP